MWCYCFFQVCAAATYGLGTLVKVGVDGVSSGGADDEVDEESLAAEHKIASLLLKVLCDGSPLVRAELAIGKNTFYRCYRRIFCCGERHFVICCFLCIMSVFVRACEEEMKAETYFLCLDFIFES